MKYQGGLISEVDEDVGVDAENQDADYRNYQGERQWRGHSYAIFCG